MKNKFLNGILIVFVCLLLVGCGNKVNNDIDNKSDNTNVDNTTIDASEVVDDLKMYSDDTKLVFELSNIKYVFYYTGDKITDYYTYVDYETPASAAYAASFLEVDDTIKKFYTEDKYLVIEYNESEYSDLSVSDIKKAYSAMKEVTK